VKKLTVEETSEKLSVSRPTTIKYFNYCRKVISAFLTSYWETYKLGTDWLIEENCEVDGEIFYQHSPAVEIDD